MVIKFEFHFKITNSIIKDDLQVPTKMITLAKLVLLEHYNKMQIPKEAKQTQSANNIRKPWFVLNWILTGFDRIPDMFTYFNLSQM